VIDCPLKQDLLVTNRHLNVPEALFLQSSLPLWPENTRRYGNFSHFNMGQLEPEGSTLFFLILAEFVI